MSGLFDMFISGEFERKPMQPIMWPWPNPTDARVKELESELAETKRKLDWWKDKAQLYACYFCSGHGCSCADEDYRQCWSVSKELSDE